MKYTHLLLILFIVQIACSAKGRNTNDTISVRNMKSGLSLDRFWKYQTGDNHEWAAPDFDDSYWHYVVPDSAKRNDSLIEHYQGIAWFRATFVVDSMIDKVPLAIQMRTNGACEVFIDGKLIRSIGTVGKTEAEQVSGFSLRDIIIPFPLNTKGKHQISLRSSGFGLTPNMGILHVSSGISISDFDAEIISMQEALDQQNDIEELTIPLFFSGVFIALCIFHFILFLYYRKNKSNLYYSLFTFLMFLIFFGIYSSFAGADLQTTKKIIMLEFLSFFLIPLFFIGLLYEVFYKRLLRMFWILSGLFAVSLICLWVFSLETWGGLFLAAFLITGLVETIRVIIRALVKKRDGARIFIFGLLFPIIAFIMMAVIGKTLRSAGFIEASDYLYDNREAFLGYLLLMSVSISMTIYLARDFARMNKKLHNQLKEIKQLFDRTIEQESERKRILENQNEELERNVTLRTLEVVKQKAEIELKNRDILDNLLYARRIQDAILPEIKLIYKSLKDSFILYWPKDIVSGDFYSFSQRDGKVIIAAADCTGHGVTGAFMSMIGSSVLNQIINERGITQPSLILNNLNKGIADALKQNETEVNDGMDIALCTLDLPNLNLQFSGANRPLWIFRNSQLMEVKPDKFAIGGFRINPEATFTNHEMHLQQGDTLYLFTDGYADQFGGPLGKKMLSKRLREALITIQDLSMKDQEKFLTKFFNEWRGTETQVDDVLVVGIRV